MRITGESPLIMREAAARRVREDYPPGATRRDLLLELGFIPSKEDIGGAVQQRRVSGSLDEWQAWASGVSRKLATRHARLMLWLPGLELRSENTALRGSAKSQEERAKSRIAVQHAARADARNAFRVCESPMHRLPSDVMVRIVAHQVCESRRIDPGNLYHKPVIDCLCERHYGLGIIADDSARYVRSVHAEYADARAPKGGSGSGVMLEITPEVAK